MRSTYFLNQALEMQMGLSWNDTALVKLTGDLTMDRCSHQRTCN